MVKKDSSKNIKTVGATLSNTQTGDRQWLLREPDTRTYLKVEDARRKLWYHLRCTLGEQAVWTPDYEAVCQWLSDNEGKGLLLYGNCGRGKSIIAMHCLPRIFYVEQGKVLNTFAAIDLLTQYDSIKEYKNIVIDDIGTEPDGREYGVGHNYVSELVDLAERKQKMLVLTTNLTYDELLQRYGTRTMDRLHALCRRVLFKGNSLRHPENLRKEQEAQAERRRKATKHLNDQ